MKPFAELLNEKDVVYGMFAKTSDPFYIRALGKAGFDFVILDNEHGPNSYRDTFPLIMAAELAGMYPVVRVEKLTDIVIQRTLDMGVAGVQIPQIQSGEDAKRVRQFTKFHPKGKRGLCPYVPAADLGLKPKDQYFKDQNALSVIIHIEGVEGIEHFDDIIAVDDIDVIFIGPYDMSQSMGIPGQVNDPRLVEEIGKLVEKCRAKGKHAGIFVDDVATAKRYKDIGVKYIAVSVDVNVFSRTVAGLAKELNDL